MSDALQPIDLRVWNRAALDDGGDRPEVGDRALAGLLLLHGFVMSGGVLHAFEALDSAAFERAIAGYRFFSFEVVADLLQVTKREIAEIDDNDPCLSDLEEAANRRYAEIIPDDDTLLGAFRERYRSDPHLFAPLSP